MASLSLMQLFINVPAVLTLQFSLSNRTMSVKDDESILSLVFTADTRWLLSGHSVTGDIRVWDAQYLNKKPVACCMAAHELGTHYLQVKPCKY